MWMSGIQVLAVRHACVVGGAGIRASSSCAAQSVGPVLLHHLVVIAHNQKWCCPLADKQSPIVFA
jgi:hypothetical protein